MDELSGYLALDNKTSEGFEFLAPHQSAMDLSGPGEVTENNGWPAPVVITVSNWYHSDCEVDPEKLQLMKQYLG